ncbi:hypothetical protein [Streptomyces sp. NPDC054865]
MRDGRIVRQGSPWEVLTEQTVADVFGLDCLVVPLSAPTAPDLPPEPSHHLVNGEAPSAGTSW